LVSVVPPGVDTVTSTVPVPGGETAVTEVEELTVKLVALVDPNLTSLADPSLVPVIVTTVPPAAGPLEGSMLVTADSWTNVNWSAALVALLPPGVLTVTSAVPFPAGATAVTELVDLTAKLAASVEPNFTAVAPPRLVPVIVTEVPPGPYVGLTSVTVGRGAKVN
jgi:hypothetical protein